MRVISRKKLREFAAAHPQAEAPLDQWYRVARAAEWQSHGDVHRVYGSADRVGKYTVFNIGGNKYRLVVEINHDKGRVFVRHVFTHREYDDWKP